MIREKPPTVLRQLGALLSGGTTAGLSDAQLLLRYAERRAEAAGARAGAEAAFTALVDRHGPMVWGVCRRTLGDTHEAEDAFQATFVILSRRAHSVRVDASLGPWLRGVARRVAARARADGLRRRSRDSWSARAESSGPEPALERAELLEAVDQELARLPEHFREPVVLCHLEGLSYAGAAERLGWPAATLKGRLIRARALLRERLARRGYGPEANAHAVPIALARQAVRMATAAANGTITEGVAPPAFALAAGVLRSMAIVRMMTLAAAVATASAGALLMAERASSSVPAPPAAAPPEAGRPANAEDVSAAIGVPLPEPEALRRLLRRAAREYDSIDRRSPDQVRRAMVTLAGAQARCGDAAGARETLRRASELRPEGLRRPGLVVVARAQADHGFRDDARATLRRVLDSLAANGADLLDDTDRVTTFAAAVELQAQLGPIEEAERLADRLGFFADEVFRRYERGIAEQIASVHVAAAMAAVGDFDAAFARASGIRGQGSALGEVALSAARHLDRATARRFVAEAADRLKGVAISDDKLWGLWKLAESQARLGEVAEARRTAISIDARPTGSVRDLTDTLPVAMQRIAGAQRDAGDIAGARATLREGSQITRLRTEPDVRSHSLAVIAKAQLGVGDIDGALVTTRAIPERERYEVLALAARAQAIAGDRDGSRETFAHAVKDAPDAEEVRKHPSFAAEVELAELQAIGGDVAGALATMGTIRVDAYRAMALQGIVQARAAAGDVAGALRLALEGSKSNEERLAGLEGFGQGVDSRLGMVSPAPSKR